MQTKNNSLLPIKSRDLNVNKFFSWYSSLNLTSSVTNCLVAHICRSGLGFDGFASVKIYLAKFGIRMYITITGKKSHLWLWRSHTCGCEEVTLVADNKSLFFGNITSWRNHKGQLNTKRFYSNQSLVASATEVKSWTLRTWVIAISALTLESWWAMF